MRYVHKLETPQFFLDDTKNFTKWDDYDENYETREKRRRLRSYLLENEQFSLCIYCESKIELDNSHVEHIKPKDENLYPELTFSYPNLAASCQGNAHAELAKEGELQPESTCGHKKSNEFSEGLFLCPHTKSNIGSYFKYCRDTGVIQPNDVDTLSERYLKANYMITTLKLNDGHLPQARLKAITVLRKRLQKKFKKDKAARLTELQKVLQRDTNAFISFLRYSFNQ